LKAITRACLSKFKESQDAYEQNLLEYCLRNAANFIRSQGYLQAKLDEPESDVIGNGIVATVRVEEGPLYRLGKITIEGADHLSAETLEECCP
jgi:outer membrane protein assembly factor BamA